MLYQCGARVKCTEAGCKCGGHGMQGRKWSSDGSRQVEADVGGSAGDRGSEEGKEGVGLVSEATGTVDLSAGYCRW
jgi:hypothetical protein